ncbi:hypothetical protein DUNSADRAFT_12560 [Dunaliella salina]|uniref:Encoded protein n=1 Tax=Dunaliella salina TaxID=3046 RepID=A0ABQ7GB40_DUNSA|nr:hypothetical protein DUNSADRAFT_12560 [Dunaliella salina]|eukprot:KAF5831814.1 hypothetical protein DUNSADRAFT_12560 [Dunaliella salina]
MATRTRANGDDHWDGAHGHWDDDYHPGSWDYDDYHGDWDHHGWDRYDEDYGDHLDPLDQAWVGDSLEGGDGEGGHWPGSHPHAGDHHRFHHGHPDLLPEEQQLQEGANAAGADVPLGSVNGHNGGYTGGSAVEGGDGGLPVLGREVPPPVLGKEELPVLGREETPPVLGREEIPVLGRDLQRGAPQGVDPAAQGSGEGGGGAPSRWQRMQEAAMPGRFRHGR